MYLLSILFSPFGFCDTRLLDLYPCDCSFFVSLISFPIYSLSPGVFFLGFYAQSLSLFSVQNLPASVTLILHLAFLYIWPRCLYFELQIVFPATSVL